MRDYMMTTSEVLARTGLSRMTVWRLEKRGRFPARRKLSPRRVAWLASEIEAWMTDCEAAAAA